MNHTWVCNAVQYVILDQIAVAGIGEGSAGVPLIFARFAAVHAMVGRGCLRGWRAGDFPRSCRPMLLFTPHTAELLGG